MIIFHVPQYVPTIIIIIINDNNDVNYNDDNTRATRATVYSLNANRPRANAICAGARKRENDCDRGGDRYTLVM